MDDSLSVTEIDSVPSPDPPQQEQQQEAGNEHIEIPRNLRRTHRLLLAASEADWTLGTVGEIKCRVCTDVIIRTWLDFKRHCNTSEAHPMRISFCDRCGDYFARCDALKRHRKKPPVRCLGTTRDKAEAKRKETTKAYGMFIGGLEQRLRSGEEVKPFSHIVKNMFPESSKVHIGKRRAQRSFPVLLNGGNPSVM